MAASRALNEPDSRKDTIDDSSSEESDRSSGTESDSDNEKIFDNEGSSYFEDDWFQRRCICSGPESNWWYIIAQSPSALVYPSLEVSGV